MKKIAIYLISVNVIDTANIQRNEAIAGEKGKRIMSFLENQNNEMQRITAQSSVVTPTEVKSKFIMPEMVFAEVNKNKLLVYANMLPGQ